MKFRVPHESSPPVIVELLERAWPEATRDDCYSAVGGGKVRVEERLVKNPRRTVHADDLVEVADVETDNTFGVPEAADLARGDGWVVVDKAIGMPGEATDDPMSPVAFLADVLGMDRDTFTPVWSLPGNAGGPWLCAEDTDHADSLRQRVQDGELHTVWVALTPQFGLPTGELSHEGLRVRYAAIRMNGGLSELQLMPELDDTVDVAMLPDRICELLALKGAPVLGDRERGGYMAAGGARLRLMSLYDDDGVAEGWIPPNDWWPQEAIVARIEHPGEPDKKPTAIRNFTVSEKTLEVVRAGHPWVLPDRDTSSTDDYQVGELVRLVSPAGSPGPFALVDGFDDVAARVWTDDPEAAQEFDEEVALRVDEAFGRRAELFKHLDHTDLFRVIHGEADGLPGMYVDRVGPLYRAMLVGACAGPLREAVYQTIEDLEPQAMILEVAHMSDVRQQGELPQARIVQHGAHYAQPGERVIGHEDGLRYWCEPWAGIDTGFFADQRDNRRHAVEFARQAPGRWLNLFCHTGAYTVALLAAGAEVVSVDLSKRYLDWLDDNIELNQLDASKKTNAAEDARKFVAADETKYDGIIVDPPTAAASDAGFWSVHKDYEALLADCFGHLNPGGSMLVCRNARRKKPTLEAMVRAAAEQAGVKVAKISPAPPNRDYPRKKGFGEGDSFEGLWVTRR
jgi:23S rRNA (cytosine1962-C5)-methyltransferase